MTTELDRLLELDDEIEKLLYQMKETNSTTRQFEKLHNEYNKLFPEIHSLKSQIESKLAQAEEREQLINTIVKKYFIPEGTILEMIEFLKQSVLRLQDEVVSKNYELSQHKKLVDAIQNRIKELTLAKIELSPSNNQHLIWTKQIDELQNLLKECN